MVTLALLAMSGLIGMVVDFGWSFFMRRAAQSAADAAATAAANSLLDAVVGAGATYANAATASCTAISDYRMSACQFAQRNGFSSAQVQVTGNPGNLPSACPPGVVAVYCVTVVITNSIPQLYSAVLGNPYATVAAKSTAAIFDSPINFSFITLNRLNDTQPGWQTPPPAGTKPGFVAGPGSSTFLGGGFAIASSDPSAAGYNLGSSPGCSPCTYPVDSRGALLGFAGSGQISQNQPDGSTYYDPFHGMGQPPLPSAPLTTQIPVPGGILDPSTVPQCASTCPAGVYYATTTSNGVTTPSGGPITVSNTVNFGGSSSWGDYVFYGGLNLASTSSVTFGPGRYVMAGTMTGTDLSVAYGATVTGGTSSDAGRMFILTDANYPGLQSIAPVQGLPTSSLTFGQSYISGNSSTSMLYGLNASSPSLPTDTNAQSSSLADFANVAIWQDQRFSNVAYTASGNIDTSCGSLEQPCTNTLPAGVTPQLTFGDGTSGSVTAFHGVVYQPRGAFMQIKPNATVSGAMVLISGTLDIGANAHANPIPPGRTSALLRTRRVAVVQ